MPTYFFNTDDAAEFVDEIGTECPDDTHAYREAVELVGTMLRDDPYILASGQSLRAEVVSAEGETLFTIVASAAAGKPAPSA